MKYAFLLLIIILKCSASFAQPFRYIKGNTYDRDSIKLLKIKSFKEYTALFADSTNKKLTQLVEYDTNGNMIRHLRIDNQKQTMNQYTYLYSSDNLLREHKVFFPDTLTVTQRFTYQYDQRGNETEAITEYYKDGKLSSSSRIIKCFDSLNRVIELRHYNAYGKQYVHYEYIYDNLGRNEELAYSDKGVLLRRSKMRHPETEAPEMYGLPMPEDPFFVEPKQDTIIYNRDGTRTVENDYDIRIFNKQNILLYWFEKHNKYKWYEYTYY